MQTPWPLSLQSPHPAYRQSMQHIFTGLQLPQLLQSLGVYSSPPLCLPLGFGTHTHSDRKAATIWLRFISSKYIMCPPLHDLNEGMNTEREKDSEREGGLECSRRGCMFE